MPKGKPWLIEDERKLRELVEAGLSISVISKRLEKSPDSIRKKCERLGLKLVEEGYRGPKSSSTIQIVVPKDLPSVEEALGILAGALKMSCTPGLDKVDVQRLQVVSTLARTYKEILADYINYREIETELIAMREKFEALAKTVTSIKSS